MNKVRWDAGSIFSPYFVFIFAKHNLKTSTFLAKPDNIWCSLRLEEENPRSIHHPRSRKISNDAYEYFCNEQLQYFSGTFQKIVNILSVMNSSAGMDGKENINQRLSNVGTIQKVILFIYEFKITFLYQ